MVSLKNKEMVMASVRVGIPFDLLPNGCDYCYRGMKPHALFPVEVVPHLGKPGQVCAKCRDEIAKATA